LNALKSSVPPHSPATLSTAASSHVLAATSFASAAKTTKDPEAHRTLELLVAEHERWATLLKHQAEQPVEPDAVAQLQLVTEDSDGDSAAKEADNGPSSSKKDHDIPKDVPTLPSYPFANTSGTPHYPARLQKSTSSLATNLASARGIPQSHPPRATGSVSSASSRRRRTTAPSPLATESSSSKPTTNPLNIIPPDQPSSQDDSFSKFYSSLNSLITRIGSPFTASLAFTGLPVGEDPKDNEITSDVLPRGWTQGRGRGRNLNLPNDGGESFYVVPYSGGTMSYANVLRRENASVANPPETQVAEGRAVRRSRTYPGKEAAASSRGSERDEELERFSGHDKTLEELQLENATLRRTLEQLSRNMQKWQKKSRESEKELKSSIMQLSKTNGQSGIDFLSQVQRRSWLHLPTSDDDEEYYSEGRRVGEMELIKEEEQRTSYLDEKVKQLEEELQDRRAEMERMNKENEKLKKLVTKFKDRWDTLREGARKRERGNAGGKLSKVEEGGDEN